MSDFTYGLIVGLFLVGINVVLVGVPVFFLGRRRRVANGWWALLPVVGLWVLGECAQRKTRDKAVLVGLVGLGVPLAQGLLAVSSRTSPAVGGQATSSEGTWAGLFVSVGAIVVLLAAVIVWLASWDALCQVTGQNSKKVWLFFVPLVNLAMPWVIALQAGRGAPEPVIGAARRASTAPSSAAVAGRSEPRQPTPHPLEHGEPSARFLRRPPAWLLSNLVLVVLFTVILLVDNGSLRFGGAQGRAESTATPAAPTPQQDRVVAIRVTCDFVDAANAAFYANDCATATSKKRAFNYRKEITVRTFSGSTYVVTVLPDTYGSLKVGDTFP